jgi:hypothetical protein
VFKAEAKARRMNVFYAAKLRHDKIPDMRKYLGHKSLPKRVEADSEQIVARGEITWDVMLSILTPQIAKLTGLKQQFPPKKT